MKLYTAAQVPDTGITRTYKNSSWAGLVGVVLVMAGITAYVAIPKGQTTNPVLVLVPGIVTIFFLVLLAANLRLHFKRSNWLVKETEHGLYVNLRSYLNYHLPTDVPSVVYLDRSEIAAIGKTLETRRLPDKRGREKRITAYIDVYLNHDQVGDLAAAVRSERRRQPKAGPFRRGKRDDYPVRVIEDPPIVRLVWDWIWPREEAALEKLGETYPIAPDRKVKYSDWDAMSDGQKEAVLEELWETGHVEQAIELTKQHHKMTQSEARRYLDDRMREAG